MYVNFNKIKYNYFLNSNIGTLIQKNINSYLQIQGVSKFFFKVTIKKTKETSTERKNLLVIKILILRNSFKMSSRCDPTCSGHSF